MGEGTIIWVRPRYVDGRPKQGWWATLVHRTEELLVLRAPLQHPAELDYARFDLGDTLVERYWFDRWYNILAVYDPAGRHKGWYANICTPISFDGQTIRYTDLDLDLWVWPDRRFRILDEDEFAARVESSMPAAIVAKARAGLEELLLDLAGGGPLFSPLSPNPIPQQRQQGHLPDGGDAAPQERREDLPSVGE